MEFETVQDELVEEVGERVEAEPSRYFAVQ